MKQATQSLNLRLAEERDFNEIVRMVHGHVATSPYKDLPVSDRRIRDVAHAIVAGDRIKTVGIVGVDGDAPVACLGAITQELPFSEALASVELVWWVDEAYRKTTIGKELKEAYEYWAKNVAGVTYVGMAAFDNEILAPLTRLYRMGGYLPYEHMFMKRV